MTEQDWLTTTDPWPMLEFLRDNVNVRKLRLWGCACCSHIAHLFPDVIYSRAVEVSARFADSLVAADELNHCEQCVANHFHSASYAPPVYAVKVRVLEAVACLTSSFRNHLKYVWFNVALALEGQRLKELHADNAATVLDQWLEATSTYDPDFAYFLRWTDIDPRPVLASLLHDIIGNPFHPVVLDQRWLTADTLGLARSMYESDDFRAMPKLADALMDAGCDDENLLAHCTNEGPHARGCWVVDRILGLE